MKTRHPKTDLDVDKVLREFEKEEKSNARRNGTFKIDAPFEKGLIPSSRANQRSSDIRSKMNRG